MRSLWRAGAEACAPVTGGAAGRATRLCCTLTSQKARAPWWQAAGALAPPLGRSQEAMAKCRDLRVVSRPRAGILRWLAGVRGSPGGHLRAGILRWSAGILWSYSTLFLNPLWPPGLRPGGFLPTPKKMPFHVIRTSL